MRPHISPRRAALPSHGVLLRTPALLILAVLALLWLLIGPGRSAADTASHPARSGHAAYVVPADSSDVELLARVIQAEAGGEPYIGQVAVGAVVVNRVQSAKFPNTIRGVITQPGQFVVYGSGKLPAHPKASALQAARAALSGEDPTNGALFFHNPAHTPASSQAFWRSRSVLAVIGHHAFTA